MRMSVDNLVDLKCNLVIYIGIIFQGHQKGLAKITVVICVPIIGRVRTIGDELFLKIRVSFDGILRRKKVFSESSHRI